MRRATAPHPLAHRGNGPMCFRALVLAVLAVVLGVGQAGAQQSASIQASAVVTPSYVDVAAAPAMANAARQGLTAGLPAVADTWLVQVRGASGASLRTVAGRGAAGTDCAAGALPARASGTEGSGVGTLCVVVEYPAT